VVPPRARACPHCGSDETTGWSDAAKLEQLGLPAEEFDYDSFAAEEFGTARPRQRRHHWIWWLTALLLVILFLWCLR
jgi:hypothetical protein